MILWYMINDLILVIQMINSQSIILYFKYTQIHVHISLHICSFTCIHICIFLCMYILLYMYVRLFLYKFLVLQSWLQERLLQASQIQLDYYFFLLVLIAYISSTTYPDFALYIKNAIWNIPTKQQGTTTTISTTIPTTIATTTTSCSGSPCDNV